MVKINKKFILFSIAFYAFAYLSGGNLPYSIFYIFMFIIMFGGILIYAAKKSVEVRVKYRENHYSVGEKGEFSIIVENNSVIPMPYVVIHNTMFESLLGNYKGDIAFLWIAEAKWIRKEITFLKRGIYNINETDLLISDLFNIFSIKKLINDEKNIKVYPKIYNLEEVILTGSDNYENIIKSSKGIEDRTLIKDIRKYRIGDNLKKVHWKLSAKHDELYVKNFDNISGQECNLFINMNKNIFESGNLEVIEERMVDFCVSFIKYMLNDGVKSKLFINTYDSKIFEVENQYDFNGLMEYFTVQNSDGVSEFSNFIRSNLKHVSSRSWIGIIIVGIDNIVRNNIIDLQDLGYKVNVFYYSEMPSDKEHIKLLEQIGVDCFDFNQILDKAEK